MIQGKKGQLGPGSGYGGGEGQRGKEGSVAQHGGHGRGSQGCQRVLTGDQEGEVSRIIMAKVIISRAPVAFHPFTLTPSREAGITLA